MTIQAQRLPLRQYWSLLDEYLRPQWRRALVLGVLIVGGIVLQLANPQIMRRFLDLAEAGGNVPAMTRLALLFIGLALLHQVLNVGSIYLSENVAWSATNALRHRLAAHCLHLDLGFHNAHTPGEMIERIDGDVTAMATFFSQFLLQIAANGVLILGVLVLLLREDWRVGLGMAGFVLLTLLLLGRLRRVAMGAWQHEREISADVYGYLEERLAGTEDIRACGAAAYVMRGFYRLMRRWMQASVRAGLMANLIVNSVSTLFAMGSALGLALGAYLYYRGGATLGAAYMIFHYATMLQGPLNQLTAQFQELQRAGAGMARVQELLRQQSAIGNGAAPADTTPPTRTNRRATAVQFDRVSFAYHDLDAAPGTQPQRVLHDVSLALAPGTVLGLLGRTGSGKSTLVRLLFRFYDPDQGAIRLDNADLRDLPLRELRQRIGMVTQEIQLFNGSVRDNLTFFDPAVPDERIIQVIETVGLGPWLAALPQGIHTELQSGGGGLSAGQAQLLASARIFLQDPGLVILDEASSRLDPHTERLVERAVDRLVADRTAIIIAHRLETVQRADQIMILDAGRVIEAGSRAALAADPASRFYRLLQTGLDEVLA